MEEQENWILLNSKVRNGGQELSLGLKGKEKWSWDFPKLKH